MNHQKILYIDLNSTIGHLNFNKIYLNNLSKSYEVDVVLDKYYFKSHFKKHGFKNIFEYSNEEFRHKTYIKYICSYLRILWKLNFKKIYNRYDIVIFGSYELVPLFFIYINSNVILINHNNLRTLKSKLRRTILRILARKFKFLVFNDYMEEGLNKIGVLDVINKPHGLPQSFKKKDIYNYKDLIIKIGIPQSSSLIFAPSKNNNIDELINSSTFNEFMRLKNYYLVVKGKGEDKLNIKFTNRFLEEKEYQSLIYHSKIILIDYLKSYGYRTSGILFEAIANDKYCLISQNESFKCYKRYFNYDPFFNSIQELVIKLNKIEQYNNCRKKYIQKDMLNPSFDNLSAYFNL